MGLFYSRRALDNPEYIREAVVRLLAKIPTMVAAFQLMRKGNDPVQPRDDLDYSTNFLYMLNEREPDPILSGSLMFVSPFMRNILLTLLHSPPW